MNNDLDFGQLKRFSLFGGVTEDAFNSLRPFILQMHFQAGDRIVTEGEVNDRIYFIGAGMVEVVKRIRAGRDNEEKQLTVMHTGDTFGEMELIDIQPCAASVRALEPTDTLSLSNRDLYRVSKIDMKTYALLVMNLAREISRRLRRMDELAVSSEPLDR
ncbi:MAG: Crp/Fnr family transcriptional regulator [Spirochaetota bacterium]